MVSIIHNLKFICCCILRKTFTVTFENSLEVFQNFTHRVPISESESHSVMSNSLRPHELQLTRLLCPWDLPGKNTGADCHFLLLGIFPTQELNLGLLQSSHTTQKSQFYVYTQEKWKKNVHRKLVHKCSCSIIHNREEMKTIKCPSMMGG